MNKKRQISDTIPSDSSGVSPEDRLKIDRNVLARVVYKSQSQYRRLDIIERLKTVVKLTDSILLAPTRPLMEKLVVSIHLASERFLQQISMGLMLPISMVCVASLARIAALVKTVSFRNCDTTPVYHSNGVELDEGEPVER